MLSSIRRNVPVNGLWKDWLDYMRRSQVKLPTKKIKMSEKFYRNQESFRVERKSQINGKWLDIRFTEYTN